MRATEGSVAADISVLQDSFLTPNKVYKIPTNVFSPLPKGTAGLTLGRSSMTFRGVNVKVGLIDSDFVNEIPIIVTVQVDIRIFKGERIAQLLFVGKNTGMKRKGDFGSTNAEIFWAKKFTDDKPTLVMTFEDGTKLEGMLDSGADVTFVASHH